jgi:glucose/mannose transport system substrate-binding protein
VYPLKPANHLHIKKHYFSQLEGHITLLKRYLTISASSIVTLFLSGALHADSDISHNWHDEREVAALYVFKEAYESLGGIWKESAFPSTEDSHASAKTRFLSGNAPIAVQGVLGGSTTDFAKAGMSANLSAYATAGNWDKRYPPGLSASGKHNDIWVSIPVFVDTVNWLFTNKIVLNSAGIDEPNSWQDFITSLRRLKKTGVIPLAIGDRDWQETMAFDHVVLAAGGGSFYDNVMGGNLEEISSETMVDAFAKLATIREFTDEGKEGRSWYDANNLVVSGQAAYIFMGPWAAREYSHMEEGRDWSCRLTPWSETVTALPNGFHFLKSDNAVDREAQRLFVTTLTDPTIQIKAALAKGTLPAVKGADPLEFSGCAVKAVSRMNSGETVIHWNARSNKLKNALKDTVTVFWNSNMSASEGRDALVAAVKDN